MGTANRRDWIKWEGGECPVPRQTGVEYETRAGSPGLGIAGDLRWYYLDIGGDIVAYRVVEEATKPVSPEDIAPELWNSYKDVLNDEALAALRQVILDTEKHNDIDFVDARYLIDAFTWSNTRQGDTFWISVNYGRYDKNRDNQQVSEGVVKIAFKETNWGVTPVKDDNEDIGSAATSKHYNAQAIQPIELMEMSFSKEEFKGFLKGNILKYSMRAGSKSGESVFKDTVKAKQYKMWLDLVDQGIKIDPRVHVVIKGD